MRKLLLCAILLMPLTSCVSRSAPRPVSTCKVPPMPVQPVITPLGCDEYVCLSVEDAVAISKWANGVLEVELALAGCPQVERVP